MTGIRKKQIIVTVLVIMIIAAGYLQYSYKRNSILNAEKETKKLEIKNPKIMMRLKLGKLRKHLLKRMGFLRRLNLTGKYY